MMQNDSMDPELVTSALALPQSTNTAITHNDTTINETDSSIVIQVENHTPVTLTTAQRRLILFSLTLVSAIVAFDTFVIGVAINSITSELGGLNEYAWITSGYLISCASIMPLYGNLCDIWGRQICIQACVVLFGLGSIVCGSAPTITALIIGRVIQGLGAGGCFTLPFIIVGDMYAPLHRGPIFALFTLVEALFTVISPVIGGIFISTLSWRYIFWINVPVCGIVSVILLFLLRIPRHATNKTCHDLDIIGALTICIASCTLILSLSWGGAQYSWSSAQVICTLILGAALIVLFILVENRAGLNALMPLGMFKSRNFRAGAMLSFWQGATALPFVNWYPLYWQNVYQDSALISGLRLLPAEAAILGSAVIGAILLSKNVKYALWPITGSLLELTGAVITAAVFTPHMPYWLQCICLIISCIGLGIISPVINLMCTNAVPQSQLAAAETTVSFVRFLGSAAGLAILSAAFNTTYLNKLRVVYPSAPPDAINELSTITQTIGVDVEETVYGESFVFIIYVSIVFAGLKVITAPWVKYQPLRDQLNDTTEQERLVTENQQLADVSTPIIADATGQPDNRGAQGYTTRSLLR